MTTNGVPHDLCARVILHRCHQPDQAPTPVVVRLTAGLTDLNPGDDLRTDVRRNQDLPDRPVLLGSVRSYIEELTPKSLGRRSIQLRHCDTATVEVTQEFTVPPPSSKNPAPPAHI